MDEFILLPQATKELQQAIFKKIPFLVAIILLVLFVLPMLMGEPTLNISASTWLTLVLLTGVMSFTMYNTLKRQKAMLLTYKLIITEETITREMQNVPAIVISVKEIKEIRKSVNGGFAIVGNSKLNAIGISTHIDRKDELEQLLQKICPITVETTVSVWTRWQYPIAFGLIALIFSSYYVSNKYMATLSGLAAVGVMVYSFIVIQISKNVEQRTKRYSYITLIPILSIIGSLIMKWMEI